MSTIRKEGQSRALQTEGTACARLRLGGSDTYKEMKQGLYSQTQTGNSTHDGSEIRKPCKKKSIFFVLCKEELLKSFKHIICNTFKAEKYLRFTWYNFTC